MDVIPIKSIKLTIVKIYLIVSSSILAFFLLSILNQSFTFYILYSLITLFIFTLFYLLKIRLFDKKKISLEVRSNSFNIKQFDFIKAELYHFLNSGWKESLKPVFVIGSLLVMSKKIMLVIYFDFNLKFLVIIPFTLIYLFMINIIISSIIKNQEIYIGEHYIKIVDSEGISRLKKYQDLDNIVINKRYINMCDGDIILPNKNNLDKKIRKEKAKETIENI